jgi:N-acetyl-anhydromuramyl-L-alanine amidase AmpD
VGAHAQFFNARSIGICLVGGSERDAKYTAAQWKSLAEVVTMLLVQYGLPAAAPKRAKSDYNPAGYSVSGGVCGHRDVSPDTNKDGTIEAFEWLKTCPGFDVAAWLKNGMQPTAAQICEVKP